MFCACRPLGPRFTSNSTFWPSFSVLKPLISMAVWCAKRSSPPSAGVMKPKPLESLNHFTVPVAIYLSLKLYRRDKSGRDYAGDEESSRGTGPAEGLRFQLLDHH